MRRFSFDSWLIYVFAFLCFLGYYVVLLFLMRADLLVESRLLTIPVRMIIIAILVLLFFRRGRLNLSLPNCLFIFFIVIYCGRILMDHLALRNFYMDIGTHLLFLFSFVVFPFLLINSLKFTLNEYNTISRAFILSAFFFSFIALFFLKEYVGTVGRLTSGTQSEKTLSPLILSYCSVLIIGFSLSFILGNKLKKKKLYYLITLICLSIVPFFLGASRGSLISLFVPFIIWFWYKGNAGSRIKMLTLVVFIFTLLLYLATLFESAIFSRFMDTFQGTDDPGARVEIWKTSLNQFMNEPFFGDQLAVLGTDSYQHNIIIEVLQTTGVVGFIPFIWLVFLAFKTVVKIFKKAPQYSWVAIIFLQSFFQSMFSGTLYTLPWLWISMALVFVFPFLRSSRVGRIAQGND